MLQILPLLKEKSCQISEDPSGEEERGTERRVRNQALFVHSVVHGQCGFCF